MPSGSTASASHWRPARPGCATATAIWRRARFRTLTSGDAADGPDRLSAALPVDAFPALAAATRAASTDHGGRRLPTVLLADRHRHHRDDDLFLRCHDLPAEHVPG